jgi:putative acetyltransferase
MLKLRVSKPEDGKRIVEIWRHAVDATHDFLTPEDRAVIDEQVRSLLPQSALWLAVDDQDQTIGFMGLSGSHMDSLFVDPVHRGKGVGRRLVEHALSLHPNLTTDVNEQNPQALGFYKRLGFVRTGGSPTDEQGRPYPLIHLRLDTRA